MAKKILIIGIDPKLIDFTLPEFAAKNLNAERVLGDLLSAQNELIRQKYNVELCLIDTGDTAEETIKNYLHKDDYDCIVIGAGIRVAEIHFKLFERLINVIHQHAPGAKIAFNTKPSDTVEAVQRWL